MFPGDPSGKAAEVVNCRCALLQRAKWGLDEAELQTLKDRAEYFGLDKAETFDEYKKTYLKTAKQLTNSSNSDILKVNIQLFARKTKHASDRVIEREVTDEDINATLKSPLFKGEIKTDSEGRKSQKFIGENVTVIYNPDEDTIVTTWKTGTRIKKKFENKG